MFFTHFRNEPLTDFSQPESAAKAQAAIASAQAAFGRFYPAIIGDTPVTTPRSLASTCPARPDWTIGRIAACGPEHVDQAVRAAEAAFETWAFTEVVLIAADRMRLSGALSSHKT